MVRAAPACRPKACAGNRAGVGSSASRWSEEGRGTDVILHLREGEDCCLHLALKSIICKLLRPHHLPILMRRGMGMAKDKRAVTTDEDETVNKASAPCGPFRSRTSPTSSTKSSTSRSPRLRGPLAWTTTAWREQEYTQLLYMPRARLRPVGTATSGTASALREARLHHGRRRAADAAVPAVRRGRRRFGRPAAERFARDPAGVGTSAIRAGLRAGCWKPAGGPWPSDADADKYATFWKEFGRVLKEGVGEDFRNARRIA